LVILDVENVDIWEIYSLCRNQVRVAPMGEMIGLDYGVVLNVIELYTADVKRIFEGVLKCFYIEQEYKK